MSYAPIIGSGGYAGWKLLTRTLETQQTAFAASPTVQTLETYFSEHIGNVASAEDLVSDYKLLKVALEAFGLGDDLNSKYFIQKVLESSTEDDASLANKLSDKTYLALAEAFGFGDADGGLVSAEGFAETILAKYEERQFEAAVGEQDESLRIALNAARVLPEMAESDSTEKTLWYNVIASEPLSAFFQGAFGLPDEISALDVDAQAGIYAQKAKAMFGSSDFATLSDAENIEKMTRNYLIRAQLESGTSGATSAALQILQNSSSAATSNILSLLL